MRDIQQMDFVKTTALTVSGGATPSVTGPAQYFTEVDSDFSVILKNSGLSTSLSVTYQLGYLGDGVTEDNALRDETLITWITPADGGAVAGMTTVNVASSHKHVPLTLAVAKFYRFTVTNNDAVREAIVRLIGLAQF